jgi:FdhD protein
MQMEITHWQDDLPVQREDQLTIEEPFEVRIGHQSLAVIMRTPGNDVELALGFLLTEGVIQQAEDMLGVESDVDEEGLPLANVLNVTLRSQCVHNLLHLSATSLSRQAAASAVRTASPILCFPFLL